MTRGEPEAGNGALNDAQISILHAVNGVLAAYEGCVNDTWHREMLLQKADAAIEAWEHRQGAPDPTTCLWALVRVRLLITRLEREARWCTFR